MKRNLWVLLLVAGLLLAGCNGEKSAPAKNSGDSKKPSSEQTPSAQPGSGSNVPVIQDNPYRKDLIAQINVISVECVEENGFYTLNAQLELPPYGQMIRDVWEETEKSAKTSEEFGELLFQKLAELAENETTVSTEILLSISSEEATLGEEELQALAAEAALDRELDAFCMEIVMECAPELVFEEAVS